jgi:glucose/arabinose dehydrogenase
MHLSTRFFLMLTAITLLATSALAQEGKTSECEATNWVLQRAPGTYRTTELAPDLRDTVLLVGGQNRKVSIPAGFTIKVFGSVPAARGLAVSPDGTLYVTSYTSNCVYALPDHNHDGIPDSIIKVASGYNNVHGIGFHNNELYFSSDQQVIRALDTNGDRKIDKYIPIVTGISTAGHVSRNFVFNELKQKMYVQIGSSCNYCIENDSTRATVMEFNMDGSGRRIFARGLRNAVGMAIDPRTNYLWVNVNGMDNIFGANDPRHNDTPAEGVYLLCDGANYGWPYAYGFRMRNPDPAYQIDTSYIQKLNGPVAEILAHSAPLGMHFYSGSAFPSKYHGALFQTYHGSWDRTPPAPPRVTVLWNNNDGQNPSIQDFVTGFQPDSTGTRWGRVVSVMEGADSALYVSDDIAGAVYRITYTAARSAVRSSAQLIQDFTLSQNTPNPFHESTEVAIDVTKPTQIIAELFDILGTSRKVVYHGIIPAGQKRLSIDSSGLTPGLYILRASDGTRTQSIRMVLK